MLNNYMEDFEFIDNLQKTDAFNFKHRKLNIFCFLYDGHHKFIHVNKQTYQ